MLVYYFGTPQPKANLMKWFPGVLEREVEVWAIDLSLKNKRPLVYLELSRHRWSEWSTVSGRGHDAATTCSSIGDTLFSRGFGDTKRRDRVRVRNFKFDVFAAHSDPARFLGTLADDGIEASIQDHLRP